MGGGTWDGKREERIIEGGGKACRNYCSQKLKERRCEKRGKLYIPSEKGGRNSKQKRGNRHANWD